MHASVILLQDDKPVSQFAVNDDQPLTLGRSTGNVIQVHDAKMSRHHSEIRATPDGYFVRDLGSKNGTFVNGARVTEARLRNDDRIQVGLAHLLFRCEAPAGEETQVAPPHLCASCGRTIPLDAVASARQTQSRVYCSACTALSPLVGRVIGRHEIVQPIGRGTIGAVYKAEQLSMGRLVALKIIHGELTADAEAIGRFLRDARAAGQLSHPNLIRIYDMNNADGFYFISMEYAQGGDAASLVERVGPLPVRQVIEIAVAACGALTYASAAGVVHGGLKPSNLLFTRDGILKVGDLGLAQSLDVAGLGTLTSAGTAVRSLFYLAPEQIANASSADPRSDVYALAITCYHLLTREFPYQVASITELARALRERKVTPVTLHRHDCPADLDAVLARALDPDPARRYPTSDDFRNALKSVNA